MNSGTCRGSRSARFPPAFAKYSKLGFGNQGNLFWPVITARTVRCHSSCQNSRFMMNGTNTERLSLKAAIETKPSSANTYDATVPLDHCYGYSEWAIGYERHIRCAKTNAAAHGGFLVSQILSAIKQHFTFTLRSYRQPHTFDLHLMFLRSVTAGQVQVTIKHVKLGNKISTVHVALSQDREVRIVGHAS